MSRSAAKNFPVTVTQLPVTRCVICQRTVAFRPGEASTALTKHYELRHKDKMGLAPAEDSELSSSTLPPGSNAAAAAGPLRARSR
jgi:hypothetical protein